MRLSVVFGGVCVCLGDLSCLFAVCGVVFVVSCDVWCASCCVFVCVTCFSSYLTRACPRARRTSTLPPTLTSAPPPTRAWVVVRTVIAPPSSVVECGVGGFIRVVVCLWCCSFRVVVCDPFLLLPYTHLCNGLGLTP